MPGLSVTDTHEGGRTHRFDTIVGRSPAIREVFDLLEKITDSDSTVVITGESGTGKGLIAKAIHRHSRRKENQFVSINCGAIPENLLESELFGHVRGAFTGAVSNKAGKFEQARGGTIFLDEIGDMGIDLQVKILRVLEEKEYEPVGGCRSVASDVRIIAATHKDLSAEVRQKKFREDLFYRLYVIPVRVPPLRERKSDIPVLIDYFLNQFNEINHRMVSGVQKEALEMMLTYSWPGNIRELRNVIERIVVLKRTGHISPDDLPSVFKSDANGRTSWEIDISDGGICLNTAVNEYEKALILKSLEKSDWVKNRAAKLLQLKRTTLVEKMKRYCIRSKPSDDIRGLSEN